jgi:hypothetical protein
MARTDLSPIVAGGPYAGALDTIVFTAADVANKNAFKLTGRELVLIQNTDASPHNVTLTSIDDPYGRQETIGPVSVAAGAVRAFWAGALPGWLQSDGKFYLEADHALVKFAIVKI